MPNSINLSTFIKPAISGMLVMCLLLSFNVLAAAKFNVQKRYLYVQPGQSIFSIVKILYPQDKEQWPYIIKQVVKKNPHAFIGADATKIQIGERLELPAISSNFKSKTSSKVVAFKKIQAVGQVIQNRGKTFVISNKNKKRTLDIGSEIFVGDRVFTGVKGFIRLNMIDEAKIDLRCNSEMLIEDYQLLRGGNRSVIYLIKGSVRKITGTIGKMADDIYEMNTPLATVGVRGTEYAIRVLQQHGCDGSLDVNSKGLFVKVNRGAIDIKSQKEALALNQGEAAHLADETGRLKGIEAGDGVFDSAQNDKKSYFFGSILWLILLMPFIFFFRKNGNNEH
ncbi:MAG: FecR family protein [Gammaproteobacteria bacterium]|nr:FecR family protein [Gammaproteobacteria bacterium]